MTDRSATLRELQDQARVGIDAPGTDYTPTNMMLNVGFHVGNVMKFGLKKRLHKKGVGKDDAPKGLKLLMISIGKLLWLLAGIAERNGVTLDACRDEAQASIVAKHGKVE